jgi:hypothetical protein
VAHTQQLVERKLKVGMMFYDPSKAFDSVNIEILFLLYINSIKSLALKGVPYLYADDIAILYSVDKYEQLKIKMEDDLQLLTTWTASIKLSINHAKTKAMLIKSNILLDVRFENVKKDFVDNFKYLGLILEKDLIFCIVSKSNIVWHQCLRSDLSLFDKWHTEGSE